MWMISMSSNIHGKFFPLLPVKAKQNTVELLLCFICLRAFDKKKNNKETNWSIYFYT